MAGWMTRAGQVLLAILMGAAAQASPCVPDPQAEPPDEPYAGYTPSGYKGALVRDELWFQQVRPLALPQGRTGYVFRHGAHARQVYDAMEPISLGGRHHGWLARREGCVALLDAQGRSLGLPLVSDVQDPGWNMGPRDDQAVVWRVHEPLAPPHARDADHELGWRLLRFRQGQLVAQTPRTYAHSYSHSGVGQSGPPEGLLVVSAGPEGQVGLLRWSDFSEVLAPEWRGVWGTMAVDGDAVAHYIVADSPAGQRLFHADGRDTGLPPFEQVTVHHNWFPHTGPSRPLALVAWAFRYQQGRRCLLRKADLSPLLDVAAGPQGQCPQPYPRSPLHLAWYDQGLQRTLVYQILPGPSLAPSPVEMAGVLVHQFPNGHVLLRQQVQGRDLYRTYTPSGERAGALDYDLVEPLGCGFVRARLQGQWGTPLSDGSFSDKSYYPFSC